MRYLLSAAGRGVLAALARRRVLVAFDYDGTLAPIVDRPGRARMRPETLRLLERVAALYPCAVISGRSAADLARRLRGVPLAGILGNHGAEEAPGQRPRVALSRRVRALARLVEARLRGAAGVEIEDKALTLAIHYRRAPAPAAAARAIRAALADVAGVRVIGGKRVVNVLPDGLPDKGSALAGLRRRLRAEAAVYVGDDETDEDVFALRPGRDLVTIRVGPCRTSRARYFLRDQDEVDTVLALLVAGRRPRGG